MALSAATFTQSMFARISLDNRSFFCGLKIPRYLRSKQNFEVLAACDISGLELAHFSDRRAIFGQKCLPPSFLRMGTLCKSVSGLLSSRNFGKPPQSKPWLSKSVPWSCRSTSAGDDRRHEGTGHLDGLVSVSSGIIMSGPTDVGDLLVSSSTLP